MLHSCLKGGDWQPTLALRAAVGGGGQGLHCVRLWHPMDGKHARLPCPSPSPGACSNSCPLSQWCHPIISSSVIPFSSCLQSFPASGSFPVSRLFASGGQSFRASASASVLPLNFQGWFTSGLTGLIYLLSKELSGFPWNRVVCPLVLLDMIYSKKDILHHNTQIKKKFHEIVYMHVRHLGKKSVH